MRIEQSAVFLNGQHKQQQLSASVQQASVKDGKHSNSTQVELSLSAKTQQQLALRASSMVQTANGEQRYSYDSQLSKQLTEAITQSRIDISQWQGNLQTSSSGRLIEIQSVTQVKSQEKLSFEALGKVETEDGRVIDFMLDLNFNRSIEVQESAYFSSHVEMIDPLMLNLNGGVVELTDQWFDFDLLGDGSNQGLLKTTQGSGYLAFDKDNSGSIDSGKELFGPSTNNGFDELRQYDEDGNGWIDESDSIYSQLGMLTFNEDGAVFVSAKDAELGAIYLGAIESDYHLLSDDGKTLGSIKQSGVGLTEQGNTLLIQEVHLQLRNEPDNAFAKNLATPINKVTGLVQEKLQRLELRQWAASSMEGFSASNGFDLNNALKDMAAKQFNFQWPEGERFSLESEDEDSHIAGLRNMVEMLKQMRETQKAQQPRPLSLYKNVSAFS